MGGIQTFEGSTPLQQTPLTDWGLKLDTVMDRRALVIFILGVSSHYVLAKNTAIKFISGPDVVTDLGKSENLVCKVENGKEYPILWTKKTEEDTHPLSYGKNLVVKNTAKFNLSYESVNNEIIVTLRINNMEEDDSALYVCDVIVGVNNKITNKVDLKVRTPVRLEDASTPEVTAVEGDRASLECVVSGFPAPRIDWTRKDGQVMFNGQQTSTGPSLMFPSIERMDRGEYVCTASNNVGPSVNMTASLIVRYGPKIGIPRPRVQQALGYDVMLQCKVDSYPTSAIDWLRDGEVVKNENRFNVAHFNTGTTSTLTTLKIYGLTESDYGGYQCKATNAHGEHIQTVELIQTKIPIPEAAYGGSLQHTTCIFTLLACAITFSISFLLL